LNAIVRCALCVLSIAAVSGCSGNGEKLTPVSGKVTVNGAPLTTGSVTYHPDSSKGNASLHVPVGALDAQGVYQLMTATQQGASPGWYKVTVTAQEPIDPKNPYAPPKHLINPKFSDPNTSGLAVEVIDRPAASAYDLTLTK
jgi:hypothetical protein